MHQLPQYKSALTADHAAESIRLARENATRLIEDVGDVERVLWDMDRLRCEVAAHPNDGMRKYQVAFARDTGVACDKAHTFNSAQGIEVTDVPAWLDRREAA
jgi:hypothetical protein